MKKQWVIWDTEIFPGFYDTYLSLDHHIYDEDCDDIYEQYHAYEEDICKYAVQLFKDILYPLFKKDVIKSMEYDNIYSPNQYNYYNDSITINIDIDEEKLHQFYVDDNLKDAFNDYLKHKFTAYDGFLPLIENDADLFFEKNYPKHFDTLLEFLILHWGDSDEIHEALYDYADNVIDN